MQSLTYSTCAWSVNDCIYMSACSYMYVHCMQIVSSNWFRSQLAPCMMLSATGMLSLWVVCQQHKSSALLFLLHFVRFSLRLYHFSTHFWACESFNLCTWCHFNDVHTFTNYIGFHARNEAWKHSNLFKMKLQIIKPTFILPLVSVSARTYMVRMWDTVSAHIQLITWHLL